MNQPIESGHDDVGVRVEEGLEAVVVVAVVVVGGGEGEKVAIGPEQAERHSHQQPGDADAGHAELAERHHDGHRDAAEQHAGGIEPLDVDVLQQEAVDQEGEGDAGVDGQLIDDDHFDVLRVAHDVGADEDVDHRQHEGVDQIREQQNPHVVRIGEEVPVFVERACSCGGLAKSLQNLANRKPSLRRSRCRKRRSTIVTVSPSTTWPLVKTTLPKKPVRSYSASGSMIGSRERAETFQGASRSSSRCAEAVAMLGVGAVVNFEPAFGSADRGGTGADAGAVPHAGPAVGEATVLAPMDEVGRFGEPDVVAADVRAAGAMQGEVSAADSAR